MTHIAIIGSGPSGCYIADMLAKRVPGASLDIYERLPTPFGLVRAGVAPDHHQTKNITRQLDRILSRDNISFIGNVNIGVDISYQELKDHYHYIIFATGASIDKTLNVAGEHHRGVYGSGEFSRWYNSHPDNADLAPLLSENVAIIGNGNVALDILRILSKDRNELKKSDINPIALDTISNADIKNIYIIGRRGPEDASFTPMELKEALSQENLAFHIDKAVIPAVIPEYIPTEKIVAAEKNIQLLQSMPSPIHVNNSTIHVHLLFNSSLHEISSYNNNVTSIELAINSQPRNVSETTNTRLSLDVGTVISAIGYTTDLIESVPYDETKGTIAHQNSYVEVGVYAVGWCKRGANGVIPSNRADASALGKTIIAAWENTVPLLHKEGFSGISTLLEKRNVTYVSYDDWQRIDKAEVKRAEMGKLREKYTSVSKMLELLD